MTETSKTLPLPTWLATLNATSLQASEAGALPCSLPDGRRTDLCGPEALPVNRSRQQASKKGKTTLDTYGRNSLTSSASAILQSSLESRLRHQLVTDGLMICRLTWRQKVTPQGWSYCQLVASAHSTAGTDFSMWPTPLVNDTTGSTHCYSGKNPDGTNKIALKLPGAAKLVMWTTPSASDGMRAGTITPNMTGSSLAQQVKLTLWPTPTTRDHKDGPQCNNVPLNSLLGRVVWLTGSDVPMEKRGQLNPRFSLWLMGYPTEWASCAERVMPSSRKSQRK